VTHEEVLAKLREILQRDFNIPAEKVTYEAQFRGSLGMDSLDVVDLIYFLERAFGLNAGLEAYRELHTVKKLCDFVLAHQKATSTG
jgi:acyl carrier protein